MKKIFGLLLIFLITLVSFTSNASPPDYSETGFYEVPIVAIDKVINVDYSPVILQENSIFIVNLNIAYLPDFVSIKTTGHSGRRHLYNSNKYRCSENSITAFSYPLLCYNLCTNDEFNKKQNKQRHIRYKKRFNCFENINHPRIKERLSVEQSYRECPA